jgi:anti-anti-sigma factor
LARAASQELELDSPVALTPIGCWLDAVPDGDGLCVSTILYVGGEVDMVSAPRLRAQVISAFSDHGRVVLDLACVTFIGAAGVRVLVEARQLAAQRSTTFSIRRPSPVVTRVLALTGLTDLIQPASRGGAPA